MAQVLWAVIKVASESLFLPTFMEILSGISLLALYVESLSEDVSAKAALTNSVARARVITPPPDGLMCFIIHGKIV